MKPVPLMVCLITALGLSMSACATKREADDAGGGAPIASAGEVLWKSATGGQVWSTPVVNDAAIFFGSDDGRFRALDLATGEPMWQFSTGGVVRSRGALCDGKVIFTSDDGFLYALSTDTGVPAWKLDTGSGEVARRLPSPAPPYDYDYLMSSPICSDGRVYVGTGGGHLIAADLATGEQDWSFETNGRIRSTPMIHGDRIYFGSWDRHVYALDAASGTQAWSFDTGGIVQASPAYGEGKIFIGSRNPKIFALDADTGESIWEHVHEDGSWVESSAVYLDGALYVGSSDALALQALDAATGTERWRYKTGGWSWSTPVVVGDTVYIGSISAYPYYFLGVTLERGLHAVDRDTGTGKWRFDTGELSGGFLTGGVHASPVVSDGTLYVAALDGFLYALKT